jgi:hypothetical protein
MSFREDTKFGKCRVDKLFIGANKGIEMTASAAELNKMDGVLATTAELNAAADNSAQAALVTPSSVIVASAASIKTAVIRMGNLILTTIVVDLTGLKSSTTDLDIIGDTGICYIGQVTTAVNGVIVSGQIRCAIVPATGVDDIDLYAATEATGAYDAAVTGLAETAIVTSGGAHAILYLACGAAGTPGTYGAGTLVIEMLGTVS